MGTLPSLFSSPQIPKGLEESYSAQPQRSPGQKEQVRGLAEKDVMVHSGDKQARHNGNFGEY
jgi:hypothetical protein